MLNLTSEVQHQFKQLLEGSEWLSNSTKQTARLGKFYFLDPTNFFLFSYKQN